MKNKHMKSKKNKVEILYFSSCGGHLVQLLEIAKSLKKYNSHFIVNDRTDLDPIMIGRTNKITHAERNFLQLINVFECIFYILKLKPKIIISTGAAPAVWFGIFGRIFGVKIFYVESLSKIFHPTLTGKIMYRIANKFYIQWPNLKKVLPKATFVGNLLQ